MNDQKFLTPPQIARRLRTSADHVLGWIRSGELKASNLSGNPRPRWKVSPDDLQAFLDRRSNVKPATVKTPRAQPAGKLRQLI